MEGVRETRESDGNESRPKDVEGVPLPSEVSFDVLLWSTKSTAIAGRGAEQDQWFQAFLTHIRESQKIGRIDRVRRED